jgi:hypothetical protein
MFGYYFRLDSNCLDNVYAHVYLAHDQNITKHHDDDGPISSFARQSWVRPVLKYSIWLIS